MTSSKAESTPPHLIVTDDDAPDLRRLLLHELAPMLHPPGPMARPRWICVSLLDDDGAPRGGLIGLTTGAWLSIDLLWLPEPLRGHGLGRVVLKAAETRAVEHGCRGATVATTSEKARRFYEKNGYTSRLVLPELRPGYTQVTLQKTIG